MKEALLYSLEPESRVRCSLCAHYCSIAPGKCGICGVRQNAGGRLQTLVFGEAAALAVDPVEKKPLFHFLPGTGTLSVATVGCNFKCAFCQNHSLSQASPGDGISRSMAPEELVRQAVEKGAASLSYTYSEPTIFLEYAYETGKLAREKGLKNIFVTNGYMSRESYPFLLEFLDAANIDLKSFSDDVYKKVIGGSLSPVLDNIRGLHQAGVFLEITTLLVPGLNDSEKEVRAIAEFIASVDPMMPWHVSRFHPDYKMLDRDPTAVSAIVGAMETGRKAGLKFIYAGNIPGDGNENTVCPQCGTLLIKRLGYARPQLFLQKGLCPKCRFVLPGLFDTHADL